MPVSVEKAVYRPDIDGLRAVAVLSVILFHIDKRLIPGGFVGVDIFFVISGFLISLHILQEIEAGKFSIVEFYRRRIKRIAPPMLVVVLITIIAAQFLMILKMRACCRFGALVTCLWRTSIFGGIRTPVISQPPVVSCRFCICGHWRVEEQFYIIWPIVLFLLYRKLHSKLFVVFRANRNCFVCRRAVLVC
ncbi:MAG: acyltransferase [Candidatus Obscuribacter sp.]|nr:acyltransferase [Candidatus Obscuribacter sp.]